MDKIIPYFEVNGQRYEIKRTRYLLAEYNKIKEENNASDEEKEAGVKAQQRLNDISKYAEKEQEFWEKFCETANDEDERKYLKFKELRENAVREYALNKSAAKIQKRGIDLLEKIAIKGLAEKYFRNGDIMDFKAAEELWCSYVDEAGKDIAAEWLGYMFDCIFGNDEEEEDNSFLSQMRKKAEQKAMRRKKK